MNKIQELKQTMDTAHAAYIAARDKFENERQKNELPELQKRYVGKYFKYRNGIYGSTTKWNMYFKVIAVTETTYARTFHFQMMPKSGGDYEITIEKASFTTLGLLKTPCSKKEFDAAFAEMMKLSKKQGV